MTIAQLCIELDVDDEPDETPAEKWRAKRFGMLDKVCARFNLTPVQLSLKPVADVADMIRQCLPPPKPDTPPPVVDVSLLPDRLREYCSCHS